MRETTIRPSEQLIRKQLTLMGSWYFGASEWGEIAEVLASKNIDLGRLATHTFSLDEAETAFRMFDQEKDREGSLRGLRERQMAFKYAFNTWVYGSFPVWVPAYTLDEAIRRLARIGYDGIEIGCAAPHAWPAHLDAGRRRALRDLMKSEGLPCVSLLPAPGGGPGNNPASPLPEERAATIAHYKEVVDLAHDLGAEKVLYIAGWRIFGTEQAQAWDWSVQALRDIAGTPPTRA